MTDEQIVKALECCGNMNECKKECPLDDLGGIDKCIHTLMLNALDLIKRQQAEIERYKGVIRLLEKDVADAKAEAVREFAERLKDKICDSIEKSLDNSDGNNYFITDVYTDIENLVMEMTEKEGGNNGTEDKH